MRAARPWLAEVVRVLDLCDDWKDDVGGRLPVRGSNSRPGDEAGHSGEEEDTSGCRPVAAHGLRFASEVRHPTRHLGVRRGARTRQ